MKRLIGQHGSAMVLIAALFVTVPRLAAVFSAVEPEFLGMKIAWLTGPGYGLANAACIFLAWQTYQTRKSLKLAQLLLAGWGVLLVLAVAIQVPAMVATIRGIAIASLMPSPLDWLLAGLLAISVELVVAVAALASALQKVETPPEKETKRERMEREAREREEFAQANNGPRHRVAVGMAQRVMMRDGPLCFYCGRALEGSDLQIDHFYPRNLGGADSEMNLVVSCVHCNTSKQMRIPTQDEVTKLQVHLVKRSGFSTKEKVWTLNHLGILSSQKDLANALGLSPSYISSLVKEPPVALSEDLLNFCEELSMVGKPSSPLTEQKAQAA